MQTTSPVTIASSPSCEFVRLPKPGSRCPVSGLSRTTLVELVADRKIEAKHLRRRGALRGIVLINRQSLVDYINGLPDVTAGTK